MEDDILQVEGISEGGRVGGVGGWLKYEIPRHRNAEVRGWAGSDSISEEGKTEGTREGRRDCGRGEREGRRDCGRGGKD